MSTAAAQTVKPGKDIVASTAPELKTELLKFIEGGVKELTVDLDNVGMVDSVGLGVLIAAHNSLHKTDGTFSVVNASEDIYKLFQVMRLDRHFTVNIAE